MPRLPRKNPKSKRKTTKQSGQYKGQSIDQLISTAKDAIDSMNIEEAQSLLDTVLTRDPNNIEAIDIYAELCSQIGIFDQAITLLQKSIQLEPDSSSVKYMLLGQLTSDHRALEAYEKGASILQHSIQSGASNMVSFLLEK